MVVYKGWITTVFKIFAIIFICCPKQSFLLWLRYSYVVFLGCLTLVSLLGIDAAQTFMGSRNLVYMGVTLFVQIRSKSFARCTVTIATALLALFFKQHSDFFEILCLLFQMLGQTCIGFSECCHYNMILSSERVQVWKFSKGFSEIIFRLCCSSIWVPGGCSYLPFHLPVLEVARDKVNLEIFSSLFCFQIFIPSTASTVEYYSVEDLGVRSGELLCFTNCNSTSRIWLKRVSTGFWGSHYLHTFSIFFSRFTGVMIPFKRNRWSRIPCAFML